MMNAQQVKDFLYERLGHYKGKTLDNQTVQQAQAECNRAIEDLMRRGVYLTDSMMPGFIRGVAASRTQVGDKIEVSLQPIYYV